MLQNLSSILHFPLGSAYLKDCHVQQNIPIYLIVIGCVRIALTTIRICCCRKKVNQEDPITNAGPNIKVVTIIWKFLDTVVLLAKIIVGSYYTFTGWEDWTNAGRPSCSNDSDVDCCAPQVIYFAFVIQVLLYGIAALLCLYVFYRLCCLCCLSVNKTESVERA